MSKLEQARKKIDSVDPRICTFLTDFNLCANGDQHVEISKAVEKKLDGAPVEFLMAFVKCIDMRNLTPDAKEQNLKMLAGFVATRFEAICLVGEDKAEKGESESYDKERHESVLKNRLKIIQEKGGDIKIGRAAFAEALNLSVEYQNQFLQHNSGPIAQKLALQ